MIAVGNTPLTARSRPPGGTAFLIRHGLRYTMVRKDIFGGTELVAIRIGGALIGAM